MSLDFTYHSPHSQLTTRALILLSAHNIDEYPVTCADPTALPAL